MRFRSVLLIVIPLVLLAALMGWRFGQKSAESAAAGGGPPGSGGPGGGGGRPGGGGGSGGGGAPASVEVQTAGPMLLTTGLDAVGTAETPVKVEISPKTSGRIEMIAVRPGDKVSAGQVLAKIDPTELQGAVSQQQAAVAEAQSRLAQAKITQAPTVVGVQSTIDQQNAAVTSAKANLVQVRRNADSLAAAAEALVADAQAKVSSAKAGVGNAQATVAREKANLNNAQIKFDRTNSLYKQGFIAAQDVDDAKTTLQVQQQTVTVAQGQLEAASSAVTSANAQVNSAQNQLSVAKEKGKSDIAASTAALAQAQASLRVAQANRAQSPAYAENLSALQSSVNAAQAQLSQARSRLAETVLRSPIDGYVTARNADQGTIASPGSPILEVQQVSWLYVTGSIPVEQSGSVLPGKVVAVTFDALKNKTFSGLIAQVNAAADTESRNISFQVKIQNDKNIVKPGMYGHITVPTQKFAAKVAIPREAVTTANGKSSVTVMTEKGEADVRDVVLGASDGKFIEITKGVEPGEKVVTLTYRALRQDQKLKLSKDDLPGDGGRPAK